MKKIHRPIAHTEDPLKVLTIRCCITVSWISGTPMIWSVSLYGVLHSNGYAVCRTAASKASPSYLKWGFGVFSRRPLEDPGLPGDDWQSSQNAMCQTRQFSRTFPSMRTGVRSSPKVGMMDRSRVRELLADLRQWLGRMASALC